MSSEESELSEPEEETGRPNSCWKIFSMEAPIQGETLQKELEEGSLPSFGFFFMLGLSAAIATLGLIANSASVIIGAMIVAPLMNPINSAAFSLVRGDSRLLARNLITTFVGVALVVGVAFLTSTIVGSRVAGSEILARTNPNLIDLGVAICAGAAGAFAVSRRRIANAIPGVAMAVALVPPLCVAGIGLAVSSGAIIELDLRDFQDVADVEWGAMILFFTNFSGIILFSSIVFLTQGYGNLADAFKGMVIAVLALALVSISLFSQMENVLFRSRILHGIYELSEEHEHWHGAHLLAVRVDTSQPTPEVVVDISARKGKIGSEDALLLEDGLESIVKRELNVTMNVVEYSTFRAAD